jgi:galactokinase
VDRHAIVAAGPNTSGRPLDLLVDVDAPPGAGLATRAAERCALRLALTELRGGVDRLPWTPAELAARSGRPDAALLVGPSGQVPEPVPLDLATAGLSLVVLDTRLRHLGLDSGLASRRSALERAASALRADPAPGAHLGPVEHRSMRYLVTEAARLEEAVVALRSRDVGRLGGLLTASHTSLSRDLRVSTRQVDATVTAVLEAGAVGARMIGRGFGGSVLALVDPAQQQEIVAAAQAAALRAGFPPPRVLPVALAAGSRGALASAATGATA